MYYFEFMRRFKFMWCLLNVLFQIKALCLDAAIQGNTVDQHLATVAVSFKSVSGGAGLLDVSLSSTWVTGSLAAYNELALITLVPSDWSNKLIFKTF